MLPDGVHIETLALLTIAALNAYTAWLAYRTKQDMHKVEIATNSMKDALVASTAKASHAEGMADQRAATDTNIPAKIEVNMENRPVTTPVAAPKSKPKVTKRPK